MEHYDWNDGWLFTPVFDPAIVRPECPELTLEPVRLPHTVPSPAAPVPALQPPSLQEQLPIF